MKYRNIREEELKNKVGQDFFGKFDCTEIIRDIDFAVKRSISASPVEGSYLLWAETKQKPTDILVMLTQLVLTIGKARTFDKVLPPHFLGCFDCEKIAFVPYADVQDILYLNDFNWKVAPSDYETREFKQVYARLAKIINNDVPWETCLFDFEKDEKELKRFLRNNFDDNGINPIVKIRIDKNPLLVPQDVRERKGSFFTPQIWVELSQKYLADTFGKDWQDEYYVWDCAAGTGNLLAGLTNKYNIWASTLDKADVDVMKERIQNGANLLESHVFQFDFLNDDFSKLPKGLQDIINDPKQRKKLIIYINPPYAEASSYGKESIESPIGYMIIVGPSMQSNNNSFITNYPSEGYVKKKMTAAITVNNLMEMSIYFAIRKVIVADWINDRDLYLFPNEGWKKDETFQNDCLAYTIFHNGNNISSKYGVNHWIPFMEQEVDARDKFDSHFMMSFISGWRYYHVQPRCDVNASLYDIRDYFQGRNEKGLMNNRSDNETYNELIGALRLALKELAKKIEPKVYVYGFLR